MVATYEEVIDKTVAQSWIDQANELNDERRLLRTFLSELDKNAEIYEHYSAGRYMDYIGTKIDDAVLENIEYSEV